MKKLLTLAAVMLVAFISLAQTEIPATQPHEIEKTKRQEIEKMLRLTGMEKLMQQMIAQMVTSMAKGMPGVPEAFWTKFQQKMDIRELEEKIIPLYDKYYSLEDLKAVNAFYESPAGQKILATLPQIMQESAAIGEEWGRKIAMQAAAEVRQEMENKDQK